MLKVEHANGTMTIKFWHGTRTKKQLLQIADYLDIEMSNYINKQPSDFKRICSITEIFTEDNRIGIGIAICSPKDNFNRSYGRKLSLENALWVSDLSKIKRSVIWKAYHKMCKGYKYESN